MSYNKCEQVILAVVKNKHPEPLSKRNIKRNSKTVIKREATWIQRWKVRGKYKIFQKIIIFWKPPFSAVNWLWE